MSLRVNIRKELGDFHLQVRFQAENEILALLGASGCGKSVTLRCISGVMTPDEGRIELDGRVLYDSAAGIDLPPQRRQVGQMFQHYALFPNMTVAQNIAAAVPRSERRAVTEELLRRFHLEPLAALRPAQLSGGQQQRTALARILAARPQAILLDEPFSALDGFLKDQLELELREYLADFPGTVIWVSHDLGEVYRNCPRVCVVHRGRSAPVRPMAELFARPETEAAARLTGCKSFAAAHVTGELAELPAWGLHLRCAQMVPDAELAGLRPGSLHPAREGEENAFFCRVERVVSDVSGTVLLLRTQGAEPEAPALRMELPERDWTALGAPESLWVRVAPEDILLLRKDET